MQEHPLLSTAVRKIHREVPDLPDGARYVAELGYWMLDGLPLASGDGHGFGPRVSKKADQETGEDQKGE